MQHLAPAVADVLERVAGVRRQPAAVAEHVAQGDLPRHPRVLHGELRIVPDDRIVPRHLCVADQRRHHGRGDRLRHRRQLEHGVVVDRLALARLPHAEALERDDALAMHDGERQAGHAGLLQGLAYEVVERRERGLDPLRRGGRGRLRQRDARHQQPEPG